MLKLFKVTYQGEEIAGRPGVRYWNESQVYVTAWSEADARSTCGEGYDGPDRCRAAEILTVEEVDPSSTKWIDAGPADPGGCRKSVEALHARAVRSGSRAVHAL